MYVMSLRSCQTQYGPCKFYGKDEYIGRSLYAYGEWSGAECEKLISLREGGTAVDIGANIGFMSMALGENVIAFEPQPELFELLVQNASKAVCHSVALSNRSGFAHIPMIRYGDKGNYGGVALVKPSFFTRSVICRTLDSYGFENVSLIKIDVEGHELEVLKGAVDTIARCRPVLYVEDDIDSKRYALREFITSLGYDIEEHKPFLFRENNFAGNKKDIWNTLYYSFNLICRARS